MKNIFLTIFSLATVINVFSQGGLNVVQLSGVVVSGDSLYGVPSVSLYVPKAGRGTTTNDVGFFSMPVLVKDSIVISAIGFKRKSFLIPSDAKENLSIVLELSPDTMLLPVIELFPYHTEEMFKQAFLALRLTDSEDINSMNKNLNDNLRAKMLYETAMDGGANHKYYMQNKVQYMDRRYMDQNAMNPLLNPFAWYQVIQSIKRGDLKKRENRKSKSK